VHTNSNEDVDGIDRVCFSYFQRWLDYVGCYFSVYSVTLRSQHPPPPPTPSCFRQLTHTQSHTDKSGNFCKGRLAFILFSSSLVFSFSLGFLGGGGGGGHPLCVRLGITLLWCSFTLSLNSNFVSRIHEGNINRQ
jgi:hypothetical protein